MAHFAKVKDGIVINVIVADQEFINNLVDVEAGEWIQTSYNTRGGKHYDADGNLSGDQSKALRGNYAGIGYTWDEDNEIFWPKQPYASWTKNTSTASWDAPITEPSVKTYTADDSSIQSWSIYWDEAAYQANNAKGWEATKQGETDVFEWNGSAWVAQ